VGCGLDFRTDPPPDLGHRDRRSRNSLSSPDRLRRLIYLCCPGGVPEGPGAQTARCSGCHHLQRARGLLMRRPIQPTFRSCRGPDPVPSWGRSTTKDRDRLDPTLPETCGARASSRPQRIPRPMAKSNHESRRQCAGTAAGPPLFSPSVRGRCRPVFKDRLAGGGPGKACAAGPAGCQGPVNWDTYALATVHVGEQFVGTPSSRTSSAPPTVAWSASCGTVRNALGPTRRLQRRHTYRAPASL